MKITVVGAGHAGSTISADLSLKGHEVTLLKTSHSIHNEHFDHICERENTIDLIRANHDRSLNSSRSPWWEALNTRAVENMEIKSS